MKPTASPIATPTMSNHLVKRARAALALALGIALITVIVACGGGGVVHLESVEVRPLSAELSSRKAVAYSPFRSSNRDSETITAGMIKQDLDLLVQGGFTLIRLFDSSDKVSKLTLQVIHDNNLNVKVLLGAYMQSDKYASAADKPGVAAYNQAEMARAVALARAFSSTVLAVSVGNENMVSWSFNPITPPVMAGYITTVRDQVTQPVTTDDNWAFFAQGGPGNERDASPVIAVIDYVSMHSYALIDSITLPDKWNWQQVDVPAASRATAMMDAAIAETRADYDAVRARLDVMGKSAVPIVIGETGWKAIASGSPPETFRAHPVNQKMFFDRLNAWSAASKTGAGPKSIVYFEAFDEPWKQGDDKWGLFNVARQARYMIQGLYPPSQWEPGSYSATDAVYYIPVVGNAPITANRYTLYAEALTTGEAKPTEASIWNAWDSGKTAVGAEVTPSPASPDPTRAFEITPIPAVWGWGMALALPTTSDNLSNFEATGTLNFSIKSDYPGKIEIGFLTGSGASAYDVYLPLSPGQYGYAGGDGQWHNVSIPISEIKKYGAKAFGNETSSTSVFDLTKVTNPFVIADRYAITGKAQGSNITTKVQIDAIYWAK